MTIDTVSDVFAFVLTEGQFSKSILFAKDMPEELTPEEKKAIEAVLGHVRASYIALLSTCRQTVLTLATDPKTRSTLESSWNRDNTIWERRTVHLPLVLKKSWFAWLTIGLWSRRQEPKETIALHAHLGVHERHIDALAQAAKDHSKIQLSPDGTTAMVTPLQPKQGDHFGDLAKQLVSELWPVARKTRQLISPAKTPAHGS